ncbi:helix-turn-helix domain-containing protein [Streptomyces sp. N50]|uniref:helix-turn-helix domain-containing protein n=1 Tax=Streptomyces sp. N50 TaxID=3081765 RepID=UPI0029623A96|nr:helix-turn-helix domain-containing protein [Streptomyces sp. N50]WOX11478.1 helix-turn-helix domain-containing protein [Streptomyces sp. N50]
MSIEAVAWAFKQKIPNPGAKLVLLALCDYADEAWSCFPGQETLADKTSQGERTVRRHLDRLEQHGFIVSRARFVEGRRTSNRYTIHSPRPAVPPPAASPPTPPAPEAPPDEDDIPSYISEPTEKETEQAANMATGQIDHRPDAAEEPASLAGEPSDNHQRNNPLPPADDNGRSGTDDTGGAGAENDVGARSGGCAAHPHAPAANCRGCGTNPRGRQAAAAAQEKQAKVDRGRDGDRQWFEQQRARRDQVARQEAQGALDGPRRAARDALQSGRERRGSPRPPNK